MSVKVLKDEDLEKHFRVVIAAKDLEKSIANEIQEIAPTIKMQGFRPGKVPVSFVKKKYGASIRSDVINKEVSTAISKIIKDKKLKTISTPNIDDVKAEDGKDVEFTVKMELFPKITDLDFKKIKIEKPVVKVSDADVEDHLKKLAEANVVFTKESKTKAVKGDQVTIDFVGYLKGKKFDGGAMEGHKLVLGSGAFIPGFEDQLIGVKAGDDVTVKVTFPTEYHSKDLAGQEAEFKVKVHFVHKSEESKLDDEFAQKMGLKDLKELKARSKELLSSAFDSEILTILKMRLFDHFEKELDFEVPASMLEREYKMITAQAGQAEVAAADSEDGSDAKVDAKKKKEDQKQEESYRRIALRRVRIGLMLADYAEKNNIALTQEDLRNAILAQARMFRGSEQMIIDFYTKNQQALESLKGPIIEDKAVKAILSKDVIPKEKEYSVKEIETFLKEENDREV